MTLLTAGALSALVVPYPLPVRAGLALAFLLGMGFTVGRALLPEDGPFWQTLLGSLTATAVAMLVGGVIYYLYRLDVEMTALVVLAVAGAAAAAFAAIGRRQADPFVAREKTVAPVRPFHAMVGALVALASMMLASDAYGTLVGAATDISIRSPWDVVPRMFFALAFLAALGAIAAASGYAPRIALVPLSALAFLSVAVAATVYRVGFGFDPFIHQATEQTIFQTGAISPKPLYYVGQYVLVTVIARFLGGHVTQIDTWLLPVVFASIVPVAWWALRRSFDFRAGAIATAAATVLLLPLAAFAATTPQGLADAFFLLTAFMALPAVVRGMPLRLPLALMTAATAMIHPLAGIPLGIFIVFVFLLSFHERTKGVGELGRWFVLAEIFLIGSVALPAVFMINSAVSGIGVSIDTEALRSPAAIIEDLSSAPQIVTRQFKAAFDFVYGWQSWRQTALLLAGLAGAAVAYRRSKRGFVYVAAALTFAVNYVLLKSVVQFPFLISYERSNYADRILELAVFVLAPMAAVAVAALFERISKNVPSLRIGAAVTLALLVTSSIYLAYPRRDTYESSRGWSTSASDMEAVRLIARDADGVPYGVLSNQSVSAAAVAAYGFATYFPSQDPVNPGPLFYYPIPTGDALYQKFLDMNTALGSRAAAQKAMNLLGVDRVYYVVSYYWWDAQEIVFASRRVADRSWNVGDKDFVFRYDRDRVTASR